MSGDPRLDDFRDFVLGCRTHLLRLADLLTGDHGRAEDLVQHSLVKTYLAWRRVRSGNPEAYARTVIVHANIDWWRRGRRSEVPVALPPDRATDTDHTAQMVQRDMVMRALASLTRKERTVLVLRYYADLSEVDTARAIGCAVGTVKSTAARAVAKLRNHPELQQQVIS